jgi:hypothetical protein
MITSPTSLAGGRRRAARFQRRAELPVRVTPAETGILGEHLAGAIALTAGAIALTAVVLVHLH